MVFRVLPPYGSAVSQRERALPPREDYEHELTLNSLWVERPEGTESNDGYAIVTGIFSTKVNGDLGGWDAGICNVTELKEWRPGMYVPSERP